MVDIQRNLSRFEIKEIARIGKIAIRREKMGESAPFWRFSTASYPDLEQSELTGAISKMEIGKVQLGTSNMSVEGDVYPVEPLVYEDNTGVCSHTLSIPVDDKPDILNVVTWIFSRRGYTIQSLSVGHSETEGMSRITTVVPDTDEPITKLAQQLYKSVDLHEVARTGCVAKAHESSASMSILSPFKTGREEKDRIASINAFHRFSR